MKFAFSAIVASFLLSLPVSANESESRLIAIKTVEVNGEKIQLSMTAHKDGEICAQYIESIQFLAYGQSAYNIGKRCTKVLPRTERT